MNVISKKLSNQEINELKAHLDSINAKYNTPPQYTLFQAVVDGCTITAYTSGKVVFQGKALANITNDQISADNNNNNVIQLGSDEVGTGDYFGPMVVVSCIVTPKDIPYLKELNVDDSKKITDNKILEIAPLLMQRLKYAKLVVDNQKYNQIHKIYNMNKIKAVLHNQALWLLKSKYQVDEIIVDQFTPANNYYKYIRNEQHIVDNIHFETKAESKYLCVAAASIIARYIFLKHMDLLDEKWNFSFSKGAGSEVDNQAKNFIQKFGEDKLSLVAKTHFKNTQKAKELLEHEK